jgi:hypothetical protein
MSKLRKQEWNQRSRSSRLASVWYPDLADAETRAEMTRIAAGEGKRPPAAPILLSDTKRQHVSPLGGLAKQPSEGKK